MSQPKTFALGDQYPILEEKIAYKRFLKVWHRRVQFPDQQIDWDIVGHSTQNPTFATVFPYDTKTVSCMAGACVDCACLCAR